MSDSFGTDLRIEIQETCEFQFFILTMTSNLSTFYFPDLMVTYAREYACVNKPSNLIDVIHFLTGTEWKNYVLNNQCPQGNSLLIVAILNVSTECADVLIDAGIDQTLTNIYGNNAIMWAAMKNNIDILEKLDITSENINLRNNAGHTALMLAARRGNEDIVKFLLKMGADSSLRSKGKTALDYAKEREDRKSVKVLEEYEHHNQKKNNHLLIQL